MSLTNFLPEEPNDTRKQIGVRLTPNVLARLRELQLKNDGATTNALIVALINKEYEEQKDA